MFKLPIVSIWIFLSKSANSFSYRKIQRYGFSRDTFYSSITFDSVQKRSSCVYAIYKSAIKSKILKTNWYQRNQNLLLDHISIWKPLSLCIQIYNFSTFVFIYSIHVMYQWHEGRTRPYATCLVRVMFFFEKYLLQLRINRIWES